MRHNTKPSRRKSSRVDEKDKKDAIFIDRRSSRKPKRKRERRIHRLIQKMKSVQIFARVTEL
jgi:hypothetical protein